MFDRREQKRLHLSQPIVFDWGGKRLEAAASELSRDNIFIESEARPPEDTPLRIFIATPAGTLELPCRVRRAREDGFAAEFEGLSAQQVLALQRVIADLPD